jgi:hypothetical protein
MHGGGMGGGGHFGGMGGGAHFGAMGGGMRFGGMGGGARFASTGVGTRFGGMAGGARFGDGRFAGARFAHAAIAPQFSRGAFRGRDGFRHRAFFRNRFNRFAFFGGDYYGGCWTQAWTSYGPQWVNACGYYGY